MTKELAELVVAAQAGDRKAFDEVVRQTYTDAFTLARRLTRNEEDARDVVQEAYLRAYRSIGSFRGDSAFPTWLYRITANCAATYMTKRSNLQHDRLDDEYELADLRAEVNPEQRGDNGADRVLLNAALKGLPDTLRAVVVLRDIYDLPHEDIARELGISETTAKVRLHRARKKLRERLYPLRGEETADAV